MTALSDHDPETCVANAQGRYCSKCAFATALPSVEDAIERQGRVNQLVDEVKRHSGRFVCENDIAAVLLTLDKVGDLRTLLATLERPSVELTEAGARILMLLGNYRDSMSAESVEAFQRLAKSLAMHKRQVVTKSIEGDDVVERVARAISQAVSVDLHGGVASDYSGDDWQDFEGEARAALAALLNRENENG